jgi:homoserine O-acetyltransferase
VQLAFETWGRPAPDRSNAVLVLHALTGDSHATGPAEPGHPTPGWWGGRYQVESYLDHHAAKLVRRFDAGSYVTLAQAMNSHDIGRGRGGTRAALSCVTARALVAGVDSDRLYPLPQQAELAAGIPTADHVRVVESPYGHDGFLIEVEQVAALVRELVG